MKYIIMNNIIDNGETQIGRVKDIVKTYKQEMIDQINNGDSDIGEMKYNIGLIIDLLWDIKKDESLWEDTIIEVKYNPMGCYQYVKYEKVEEIK